MVDNGLTCAILGYKLKQRSNTMEKLTLEQVRDAINWMQRNYDAAMASKEYGLADKLHDKLDALKIELVGRITSQDPYITVADVRYFEGW